MNYIKSVDIKNTIASICPYNKQKAKEMIINSILDTDLYKLTMQNLVLHLYPDAVVKYKFNNRNKTMKFNTVFLSRLKQEIESMSTISLEKEEKEFLRNNHPELKESYINYLSNYRFNPKEVTCELDTDGNLEIDINGKWYSTILWEVPLMAVISELYFELCDTDWIMNRQEQALLANDKAISLSDNDCYFADFGTRRRRTHDVQSIVVGEMMFSKGFVGTSNVHLAHLHGTKAIGTMAHEFIMGVSALKGLRRANHLALTDWHNFYNGSLGVALTDTFGTDAFFNDFDLKLAKLYDVRHDSGSPYDFTDKVISKYSSLGIDTKTKTIVFSDGLDVDEAIKLREYCEGKIKCAFGLGTSFTNDFHKVSQNSVSKPLNMVIKLYSVNDIPVVKISDSATKAIGDKDALRVAMWTFFNKPLDA